MNIRNFGEKEILLLVELGLFALFLFSGMIHLALLQGLITYGLYAFNKTHAENLAFIETSFFSVIAFCLMIYLSFAVSPLFAVATLALAMLGVVFQHVRSLTK